MISASKPDYGVCKQKNLPRKIRPRKTRPPQGLSKIHIEKLGKVGKFAPRKLALRKKQYVLNFTNELRSHRPQSII